MAGFNFDAALDAELACELADSWMTDLERDALEEWETEFFSRETVAIVPPHGLPWIKPGWESDPYVVAFLERA